MKHGSKWMQSKLFRISLTNILLVIIAGGVLACVGVMMYAIHVAKNGAIVDAIWHLDLWNDAVRYIPFFLTAITSGFVGAKARVYMDEMKLAKNTAFATLTDDMRQKILNAGFANHNYLLGMVAALVAIVTLGEELSILHQFVMGVLSSMVGSQFLAQRLEGGAIESPHLDILTSRLERLGTLMNLGVTQSAPTDEPENNGTGTENG